MKENKRKQNGITLIALIITIIVMLILVGVTINVALNGELFKQAQTAASDTQKEAEREQLLSSVIGAIGTDAKVDFNKLDNNLPKDWTGSNGTYTSPKGNVFTVDENGTITEGNGSGGGTGEPAPEIGQVNNESGEPLQVGDFIKYNNETWVVFYNDEEYGLQIVSRNAKTGINELSGKVGYSNAISLLNKECERYMTLGTEYARVGGTSPKFHMKGGTAEIDEFGMIAAVDDVGPDDNEDYASFINLMSKGKFSLDGAVITGVRVFDERDGWREYQLSTIFKTEQSFSVGSVGFCRVSLDSGEVIEEVNHYHGPEVDSIEEYGIFPVIILNKNIQITGGDGSTLDTAYTYSFTNN